VTPKGTVVKLRRDHEGMEQGRSVADSKTIAATTSTVGSAGGITEVRNR